MTSHLPDDLWQTVQATVPILCVDIVPTRTADGGLEVGLIRRRFADTGRPVWCHLGGRVRHGETTSEAISRHIHHTLDGAALEVGDDPQPHHVMQWFPSTLRRAPSFGDDPRKHALSLCWALDLGHQIAVRAGGEGTDLAWFRADLQDLDDEALWPGTRHLVTSTLRGAGRLT